MTERDNIRMEINIAGEPMLLTVPFRRQSAVRDIEEQTNMLYRNWRARFPKKTDKELLAMMVYQYASFYDELLEKHRQALAAMKSVDETLGGMLAQ